MTRVQFGVIVALLVILIAFHALPVFAPARFEPQYEYRIEDIKDDDFREKMDSIGYGRWDLVFARRALGEGKQAGYEVIFRRAL